MMYDQWGWGYGGMGWGMGLGMLLFWGLIVLGIVALVRGFGRDRDRDRYDVPPSRPTAREILDQRYARSEIGREEYEQKRRDLDNP